MRDDVIVDAAGNGWSRVTNDTHRGNPDLEERFAVLDLAEQLADVDEAGSWWALAPEARDRYERMALVAFDAWERAHHTGFREALGLLESVTHCLCLDCDEDTAELGEGYMLHDEVWLEANPRGRGMLCVGCVEKRLGRQLEPDDFTDAPLNQVEGSSTRLRARLLGGEAWERDEADAWKGNGHGRAREAD